jgi:hypothetical protein
LSKQNKKADKTIFGYKNSNDILSRAKSAKYSNFINLKHKKSPSLI